MGFQDVGQSMGSDTMPDEMRLEIGTIFVFDTRDGKASTLRGHLGPVLSLEFVPSSSDSPLLVSLGWERDTRKSSSNLEVGVARIWQIANTKPYLLGQFLPPLPPASRPDLAVRRTGRGVTDFTVAIAWSDKAPLQFWDVANNQLTPPHRRVT
jgi:hypothetical protein